ncbi:hypothetical protein OF375_02725 [Ureaplasma miroungigenitalium]|uniref:hypothetical protein n=1 Tax=Ureaplasma miroungigenitalium TaxID=1042321 RepID=UPI0021E7F05F|nr:hypothetical protein [Ureaplasma miroungigenitalium]MCV3734478.1 hypothetical protein [Ureaplasma miroungigenitalium]
MSTEEFLIFDKFKSYLTDRFFYKNKFLVILLLILTGTFLILGAWLLILILNHAYNEIYMADKPTFAFNAHIIGCCFMWIGFLICLVPLIMIARANTLISFILKKVVKNYLRKQKAVKNQKYFVFFFKRFLKYYRCHQKYDANHFYHLMLKETHGTN